MGSRARSRDAEDLDPLGGVDGDHERCARVKSRKCNGNRLSGAPAAVLLMPAELDPVRTLLLLASDAEGHESVDQDVVDGWELLLANGTEAVAIHAVVTRALGPRAVQRGTLVIAQSNLARAGCSYPLVG